MFRRPEKDDLNPQDQSTFLSDPETVTVINPQNAPVSAAPAPAPVPMSQQAFGTTNRPAEAPRQTAPQPVNAFRPTASQPAAGGRLPETKANFAPNQAASFSNAGTEKPPVKANHRVVNVGQDINIKGEITNCDRIVIEGKVDASLSDVHTVEVTASGSLKGIAVVEDAEISGLFEGELVVKGRLVIYATGKVRGKITYGEIEIQGGGELTGEIKLYSATQPSSRSLRKDEKVAA